MTFRVGEQVVCIDAARTDSDGVAELVEGRVYIVRWEGVYEHPFCGASYCIRVEGIIRTEPTAFGKRVNPDCPFDAARFRPLVETDISIFTAMLKTSKERA